MTQSAPDAAAAIRQILDAQANAWNGADSAAWAAPFADNADFVNILGQAVQGRRAIAALHGRIFSGPFQGSHASITIRQITPIAPGALLVETMYEVTHYRFLLPGVQPTSEGVLRTLMKYVAVNRGGGWQFLAAQNTAVLPGYPPAAPPG